MSFVKSLTLHNFRNYTHSRIDGLDSGFIVLAGANGAGKTNCLEAVSLLAPGRGLRNAKPQELRQNKPMVQAEQRVQTASGSHSKHTQAAGEAASTSPWAVRGDIAASATDEDIYTIATGENPAGQGRIAKLNGEKIAALSQLSDVFSCVWFTPSMSGLFLGSASERRRFFDRLVFAYDPSHAGRLRRYEKALSERSRILKDAQNSGVQPDSTWLDGIEITLAETSVALAASRLELLDKLQDFCRDVAGGIFPPLSMHLTYGPEEMLAGQSALYVEDRLREWFKSTRTADSYTGGSAAGGAHRSDMAVTYLNKNMPADQCSTGEQKALLLTIILAHASFMHYRQARAPVLLLDEITAHLDEKRRQALFDLLRNLQGQVWMSGTEKELFNGVSDAHVIAVADNALQRT